MCPESSFDKLRITLKVASLKLDVIILSLLLNVILSLSKDDSGRGIINILLKKLSTIILIIFLTSCADNWYKPMGQVMFKEMPKGGSPGFELGWKHGCESGLGTAFANGFYMAFYTWHRDVDITSSKPNLDVIRKRYKKELKKVNWKDSRDIDKNFNDYNTIFWSAHAFCRHSVVGIQQTAGTAPKLPGDSRYDPSDKGNTIGGVWNLNGRGDVRIGATGLW